MNRETAQGNQEGWEADWEGTSLRQLRMNLKLTPAQRIEALEKMLELAHEAGALQRAARQKQKEIDAMWGSGQGA